MGPVPGVRLWQPRSQCSLLPVQAREPGNKVAITWGRRKEMYVSERKKKTVLRFITLTVRYLNEV